MASPYFDKHREKLDAAVAASASREYYSAYDESPSPRVYGETAAGEGRAAFEAWLGEAFPVATPAARGPSAPSGRRTASISASATRVRATSTPSSARPRPG